MAPKKSNPVIVERTFNVPVDQVWRAITDKDEMKQWYFQLERFEAVKGFEFDFMAEHKGMKFVHLCCVKEVILYKKLSYSWRYKGEPGNSLVTFELFAEGNKTRVKLTHAGLESFPAVHAYDRKNFERGWNFIIGTGLQKYTRALSKRSMVISRLINAPVKRVWDAFADTKQVVQWWGPNGFTTTTEKREFKPGGVWNHTMHGPDGTDYPNFSTFIEIEKYKRVVYSIGDGKKGSKGIRFISTWVFEPQGQKTQVTLRGVFPTVEDYNRVVKQCGAIEGGKQTLGRLNSFLNG
jgi:uncharacterized protein YndB with AHSA1/START domain